ncbi:MAG: MipA/OmpV family protein [Kiritimatiellae bacterium]|nr:MipA/OmpV family protein [Kiritimatiellia bacterium]
MKKIIAISLLAALIAPLAAFADDDALDVTVSADILSAYLSRGATLNDEAVFQPDLYVAMPYGFDFELWATMDLTDNDKSCAPDTKGRWSEFDFILGWNALLPEDSPIGLRVFSTFYTYPQVEDDDDYDAGLTVSGNCILNPTVTVIHECDKSGDIRFDASVSHEFDLSQVLDALTLGLKAETTFGTKKWMRQYDIVDEDGNVAEKADAGFNDVMLKATLGYQLTDAWSIALVGGYGTLLGDARDAAKDSGEKKDCGFGGFNTSYTF